MHARDAMRGYVVTASDDDTVGEVAEKLAKHRISGLPVVNENEELVGMISESDIIKKFTSLATESSGRKLLTSLVHSMDLLAALCKTNHDKGEMIFDRMRQMPVSEVMTRKIVFASPDDSLQTVAGLMTEHNVNRIPIIEEGKLIGIVGRADVVKRVRSMNMTFAPKV